MNVIDALQARKSVRCFLDQDVSADQVTRILDAARNTPSGVNAQPWQVAVVSGAKKKELGQLLETAFRNEQPGQMDYQYYPRKWVEPYKTRRFQCGVQLYEALGIKRHEKERRREQWVANFRAFDAPVMLLFFIDSGMGKGSYLDYGMFLQSIMLAAVSEGLATCPQAALGEYPVIVKDFLGYDHDLVLIGGMALGFEDTEAAVNNYRTPRAPVTAFTRFFE
ncbi:MAG: nitroreductase [Desulfobacterales bacterium]|nr:MAG: nitroreductase [Desulfobacterales bacterium]